MNKDGQLPADDPVNDFVARWPLHVGVTVGGILMLIMALIAYRH